MTRSGNISCLLVHNDSVHSHDPFYLHLHAVKHWAFFEHGALCKRKVALSVLPCFLLLITPAASVMPRHLKTRKGLKGPPSRILMALPYGLDCPHSHVILLLLRARVYGMGFTLDSLMIMW
jgi:hypothetical protein